MRIRHVLQQRAGSGNAAREILTAESAQVFGAKLRAQQACRAIEFVVPRRSPCDARPVDQVLKLRRIFIDNEFGRLQAFQFAKYGFKVRDLGQAKAAARQVEPGNTETALVSKHRGDKVVTMLGEQRFVSECAGCNDACDLTLDGTLARCRIANLLADGDRFTLANQLRKVTLRCVVGNAGHRDRVAAGLAARCQGNAHQRRGLFRIVVEQLIEVAHAVEHQHVRIIGLDRQVLAHHRRVNGGDFGSHLLFFFCWGAYCRSAACSATAIVAAQAQLLQA